MLSKKKLDRLVNFYLRRGDLSHQKYATELLAVDEIDVDEAIARMFSITDRDALQAWKVAWWLQSLREGERLDAGERLHREHVDLWELYLDAEIR